MHLKFYFFFLSLFISVSSQCQKSNNPALESEVKQILASIDKGNLSSTPEEETSRLYAAAISKSYDVLSSFNLNCIQKGRIFLKIGYTHFNDYEDFKAIEILRDSVLGAWIDCPGLEAKRLWDPAVLLFDLYVINNRLDDAGEIIDFIERTKNITKGIKPKNILLYYSSLGNFAAELNDQTLASQSFNRALNLLKKMEDKDLTFSLYSDYANAMDRLGEADLSISLYEKALNNVQNEEQKILTIINYSERLIKSGNLNKADSLLNVISPLIQDFKKYYKLETVFLQRKAFLYNKTNRFQESIKVIEEANQSIANKEGAFVSKSVNQSIAAEAYYGQKNIAKGDALINESIGLLLATNDSINIFKDNINTYAIYNFRELLTILSGLVEDKIKIKDKDHAILALNQLQSLIDRNKLNLSGESSQIFQTTTLYPLYEKVINFLVSKYGQSNDRSLLYQAIELSIANKGRILNAKIDHNKVLENELDKHSFNKLKNLGTSKREAESQVVNANNEKLDSLNDLYFVSLTEYNNYLDSLMKANPNISAKLQQKTSDLKTSQLISQLGSGRGLLEIFKGLDDIYVFCITSDNLYTYRVKLTPELQSKHLSIQESLQNYNEGPTYYKDSEELYHQLYEDALNYFKDGGISKVIVSSDGFLHYVPLETFWTGSKFVQEDYEISYLMMSNQLFADNKNISSDYLGFGTSYTPELNMHISQVEDLPQINLSQLPLAEDEIKSGVAILNGTGFLGKEATAERFLNQGILANGIIHLALHGLIINDDKYGILFHDEGQKIFIDQIDIESLDLKNDLSIISACHSGDGAVFQGEGVRSLTRSFLFAGSKNVVPSLWAASDVSNKEIMVDFLSELSQHSNPLLALNQAKRNYIKSASPATRHPSYWGNMVYIGVDTKESIFSSAAPWKIMTILLGTFLLGWFIYRFARS